MKNALQKLIAYAINRKGSDIHLTIVNRCCKYEIRINGQLYPIEDLDIVEDDRLFQYIKYISGLELSNKAKPQTGRFSITINNQKINCRFALVTSIYASSGVIRLLNNGVVIPYYQLTNDQYVIKAYEQLMQLDNGLIIISGATGSGKTTTAYSLLHQMSDRKIYTIEDPIEIFYPFMMQIQLNENNNMTYDNAIKQIMRQDPDIIFIGEIRDEIAALMCMRAALTGHLVIATIHSGSCSNALYRLLDLKVNKIQLFDVLKYVTNQRLIPIDSNQRTSVVEIMNEQEIDAFYHQRNIYEII